MLIVVYNTFTIVNNAASLVIDGKEARQPRYLQPEMFIALTPCLFVHLGPRLTQKFTEKNERFGLYIGSPVSGLRSIIRPVSITRQLNIRIP